MGGVVASAPTILSSDGYLIQIRDIVLATSARIKSISLEEAFQEWYLGRQSRGLSLPHILSLEEFINESSHISRSAQERLAHKASCVLADGNYLSCNYGTDLKHNHAGGDEVWALLGVQSLAVIRQCDDVYVFK
jgi:hypothetical protein